jgi:SAM-dependent methyltransferase
MPLDEARRANLANWNDRARIHYASRAYDIQGYVSDASKISDVVAFDRDELGDVTGKTLLHLQCHIGTDTLSWARLGATVTGVDLSDKSIEAARRLSAESGTPGRFIVSELYDTPDVIEEQFDIVYTGVGALCWLPDIRGWASVVAKMLGPGGTFYIRDGHPMAHAMDNERHDDLLLVSYPYFETQEGMRFEDDTTYTDGPPLTSAVSYEWNHGLGEIVTALIDAGLRIEFLHELRFSEYQHFPSLAKSADGRWRFPEGSERVPLMFSIKARKE